MKKLLLLLSLMLILPGYHQTATIETVSGTTSAQVYPAWYLSLCQAAVKDDSLTQDEFLQAFPDAAVRETIQGSYALVLADDSTQGFAFFNEKDALWNFIRVDRFKTKAEFEQHVTAESIAGTHHFTHVKPLCLNATFAHILPLSPLRLTPSFPKMLSLCRRVFSSSAIRQRISRWRRSFGSATRNFFPTMAGC